MRALVIHESLTGNTRTAARTMVAELQQEGWEASECSSRQVDLAALHASIDVAREAGCSHVIFGCTELSVVYDREGLSERVDVVDSLRTLAEATILEEKTSNPELYDRLKVDDIEKDTAGGLRLDQRDFRLAIHSD